VFLPSPSSSPSSHLPIARVASSSPDTGLLSLDLFDYKEVKRHFEGRKMAQPPKPVGRRVRPADDEDADEVV
jgi:hypothetical protein